MNPSQPVPPEPVPKQDLPESTPQLQPSPDSHAANQVVAQIPGAVVEMPHESPVATTQPAPHSATQPVPNQVMPTVNQPVQSKPTAPEPQLFPGQAPLQYPVAQQPVAQQPIAPNPTGATGFDATVATSMRSRIIKVIAGLTLFSLIGVGVIYFVSNSADSALSEVGRESNTLATYDVPTAWNNESDARYLDYFNGDTRRASSAIISVLKPQRLKFSGTPLTVEEIEQVIDEISNLEARNVDAEIQVISESQIVVDGFERSYEYQYESLAQDGGNVVRGVFRVYFDNEANLHTFEVAAVSQYWNTNQAQLEAILDSYSLAN